MHCPPAFPALRAPQFLVVVIERIFLYLIVSFPILSYLSLSFSQVVRCVLALISKTDPALAELAFQLACLHPVGIPRALFPEDEATDARLRTLFRPVAPPLRLLLKTGRCV